MNAIANPTLQYESVIYVFSLTLESDLPRIVSIEKRDNAYNGYSRLYDALMDLIPEQVKNSEDDDYIARLYLDVKHAMCATSECPFSLASRTSRGYHNRTSILSPHVGKRRLRWM
jgi:hypothetical protein